MTHTMAHGNTMSAGMAFLAGISAGALAALLLAPRSGHETRHQLKEAAMNARRKAQQTMQEQAHKAEDMVDNTLDTAKGLAEKSDTIAGDMARKSRRNTPQTP